MEDRCLLISDVDGTLLGDDDALADFARWYERQREWLDLAYNSGRFVDSVLSSVAETDLPQPNVVIGGVGTQIHCCKTQTRLRNWPSVGSGWQPSRICAVLSHYDEMELQPAKLLSDHKISYYARAATPALLDDIGRRLAAAHCDVDLVYSSSRDLDVLPRGVNKGTAAAHLASHGGFPNRHVFVSGDSANDLAMFEQGFRGIVVGNAHAELRRLNTTLTYQAKSSHATGVVEGLTYWLNPPLSFRWLTPWSGPSTS